MESDELARGGDVESGVGAAAADHARCSEVGAATLHAGEHTVVTAALCLGVVQPMSSGIDGGAFVVVRGRWEREGMTVWAACH